MFHGSGAWLKVPVCCFGTLVDAVGGEWATALYNAAKRGDLGRIVVLLNEHPQLVNARQSRHTPRTALMAACAEGHYEVVR